MTTKGKSALVTGASTGIGRAVALALAANGIRTALLGRDESGLTRTRETIEQMGGAASVFLVDLRDVTQLERTVKECLLQFGHIDIVANIAGVWHSETALYYGPTLDETPIEQLGEVFDVNLRAPILLTRQLLPSMKLRKSGKVINISGTFSSGGRGWLHYFVSKQAIEHFTLALADEVRDFGIQVNCISPSDVATEAFRRYFADDVGSALDPADVARLALFLALDGVATHITGQVIVIKKGE